MGCSMQLWNPQHPAVATVHDLGALELPEERRTQDPVARQLLHLSLAGLKSMDAIIAVSEFTRRGVIEHLRLSPDQVFTIHSGIDHDLFNQRTGSCAELARKYPELDNISKPWLLYVGSELPRKNLGLVFEAIAQLIPAYPGIRLIKIGPPGGEKFREKTLRDIQRKNLIDRVHFFDEVPDDDLVLFYNSADALVQPSKMEGFSFPVLEAMACGLPVISSTSGALPEISGDASLLVPDLTAPAFARSIREFLEDVELRKKMVADGIRQAGVFRWQKSAQSLVEIYQGLNGESQSR
jgi:glycosyltransferase involved in cell wall biosynthesis